MATMLNAPTLRERWLTEWEDARAAYRQSGSVEDRERVSRALRAIRAIDADDDLLAAIETVPAPVRWPWLPQKGD